MISTAPVGAVDPMDRMLAPFGDILAAAAHLVDGDRVVDVGCGHGATTLAAARLVGPTGWVVGVDRDPAAIAVARRRAEAAEVAGVAEFVHADAAAFHLGDGTTADVVLSRFGTLHFTDPVAAHANVRRHLRPRGRLVVTTWRGAEANAWATIPDAVVARHLPPRRPEGDRPAGGPFTLAEPARVCSVLWAAGFVDVDIRALDVAVTVGTDVADAVAFFEHDAGDALRRALTPTAYRHLLADLVEQLRPFAGSDGVRVPAGAWLVRATAP